MRIVFFDRILIQSKFLKILFRKEELLSSLNPPPRRVCSCLFIFFIASLGK